MTLHNNNNNNNDHQTPSPHRERSDCRALTGQWQPCFLPPSDNRPGCSLPPATGQWQRGKSKSHEQNESPLDSIIIFPHSCQKTTAATLHYCSSLAALLLPPSYPPGLAIVRGQDDAVEIIQGCSAHSPGPAVSRCWSKELFRLSSGCGHHAPPLLGSALLVH